MLEYFAQGAAQYSEPVVFTSLGGHCMCAGTLPIRGRLLTQ
jgi:hypothetical protein